MRSWREPINKKYLAIATSFAAILLIPIIFMGSSAHAAEITNRSLLLEGTSSSAGGSAPGGVVNDLFTFTTATSASIGSIQFLYCTTADGTCITPTGLVTTSATLGSQSGATGFSIVNSTNGAPYIQQSTPVAVAASTQLIYQLAGVTNPTAANASFYVRISTFTSSNITGTPIDTGNVAASTANQIVLTGQMPESLVFCTGGTIGETSGIPNCASANSGNISFSTLFSPTAAATATSQMAASTNASHGYVITVNGATLTSSTNSITAMTTASTSVNGVSQFGMNLVANTTATSSPAIGANITPASGTTGFNGQALTGYATPDTFKFNSGDSVANSAYGGSTAPSNAQIYTVSYIVNVPGDQAAGVYTTTLTYICTATF